MQELDFIAKYGPTGILGLLLIGAGKVGLKVIDRWFTLSDKIEAALDNYNATVLAAEVVAERRHSETRELVRSESELTRRDIRQVVDNAEHHLIERLGRTQPISGPGSYIDVEPLK